MSSARGRSAFGPLPVAWRDVESWSKLYGVRLHSWELDTLRRIDDEFMLAAAEASSQKKTKEETHTPE